MKKLYLFFIIGIIVFGCGIGLYFYKKNHNSFNNSSHSNLNDFSYNSTRVSTTDNSSENFINNITQENPTFPNDINYSNSTNTSIQNNQEESKDDKVSTDESNKKNIKPIETEIASFTTKIYTKDSDRQNNLSITCSSLNNTTVENGKTFSFCKTIGKATTSKGYKKADVYKDGEKIEALGRTEIARLVQPYITLY